MAPPGAERGRKKADTTAPLEKRKGGVTVFVKNSFLAKFTSKERSEVINGRMGIFRLCGNEGNMDMWNVYLPASDAQQRQSCLTLLAKRVLPEDKSSFGPCGRPELLHSST